MGRSYGTTCGLCAMFSQGKGIAPMGRSYGTTCGLCAMFSQGKGIAPMGRSYGTTCPDFVGAVHGRDAPGAMYPYRA